MGVTVINSIEQFHEIINGDKAAVIDFWATWCGPCRVISPIFDKLSELAENTDVGFYKVDVDEQSDIAQEVGVRAMPTFVAYRKGEKVKEVVGANPANVEALIAAAKI